MEVGTIASVDVAAALRCDRPSQTSAGTITVPPPMPNVPDSTPTNMPDHNQHDDAARRPIKRRLPRSRFHLLRFRSYGIRPIRSFPFITHGSSFHVFRARYYPPAARSNQPIP